MEAGLGTGIETFALAMTRRKQKLTLGTRFLFKATAT